MKQLDGCTKKMSYTYKETNKGEKTETVECIQQKK